MPTDRDLLSGAYDAFNARDIAAALAVMHPDVDWPNGMEGGRIHGRDGVRDYWTRQWAAIDPHVTATGFTARPDGSVAVDVHQLVRALDGALIGEGDVQHVYVFRDDLVARMDVVEE